MEIAFTILLVAVVLLFGLVFRVFRARFGPSVGPWIGPSRGDDQNAYLIEQEIRLDQKRAAETEDRDPAP